MRHFNFYKAKTQLSRPVGETASDISITYTLGRADFAPGVPRGRLSGNGYVELPVSGSHVPRCDPAARPS